MRSEGRCRYSRGRGASTVRDSVTGRKWGRHQLVAARPHVRRARAGRDDDAVSAAGRRGTTAGRAMATATRPAFDAIAGEAAAAPHGIERVVAFLPKNDPARCRRVRRAAGLARETKACAGVGDRRSGLRRKLAEALDKARKRGDRYERAQHKAEGRRKAKGTTCASGSSNWPGWGGRSATTRTRRTRFRSHGTR